MDTDDPGILSVDHIDIRVGNWARRPPDMTCLVHGVWNHTGRRTMTIASIPLRLVRTLPSDDVTEIVSERLNAAIADLTRRA